MSMGELGILRRRRRLGKSDAFAVVVVAVQWARERAVSFVDGGGAVLISELLEAMVVRVVVGCLVVL